MIAQVKLIVIYPYIVEIKAHDSMRYVVLSYSAIHVAGLIKTQKNVTVDFVWFCLLLYHLAHHLHSLNLVTEVTK